MTMSSCAAISCEGGMELRLVDMLTALGEEYPVFTKQPGALRVRFVRQENASLAKAVRTGDEVVIHYSTLQQAARFVGSAQAGLIDEGEHTERFSFEKLAFMICAAHNKVFTVTHIQKWLRRMALFGFNQMLLYVDDTYEVQGEPFFGYMRGRYTAKEIQAIDAYAARLGIELVPAIQTLGHLSQLVRWPAYKNVQDTRAVILADEEATYKLIEKMIAFWKQNTRAGRIHLGMDEAHDLGRGVFMDKHGPKPAFDIFNRHLGRVVSICEKHSLEPMIWSDMYFRMGSPSRQDYYDPATVIPPEVKAAIPAQAQLVYWDYYHHDKAFYKDWIARHKALGKEPVVASAAWTWSNLWHNADMTEKAAKPCIEVSIAENVRNLIVTMWGDDGSTCDFDSAMLGFAFCAEQAFAHDSFDRGRMARRFEAVTGANYAAHMIAAEINSTPLSPMCILWDNPVYHMYLHNAQLVQNCDLGKEARRFEGIHHRLSEMQLDSAAGNLWHAAGIANYMAMRLNFADSLFAAWPARNRQSLDRLWRQSFELAGATDELAESFRSSWFACAKPFGLEVIQMRLAAIALQFRELARRLRQYLDGQVETLDELDANIDPPKGVFGPFRFSHIFTACDDIRK
jgi:hexosaminidase